MGKLFEYIKNKWNRHFAIKPSEKYPSIDDGQSDYREEFRDIVDKYLIDMESHRDADHPTAYHRIVYIDVENDIDWQVDGEVDVEEEALKQRKVALAKLGIEHAKPVQNLSEKEVFNFKKILGEGYSAALTFNFDEVETAIIEAEKYRNDRNKERSRWLLLTAASWYLLIIVIWYVLYIHFMSNHPHFEVITGVVMGAMGSYVSIWSRYGKMDMTGLGTKGLHYLEALARMLIGAIFSLVLICALKSGIVLAELAKSGHILALYMVLGFVAGFSEQFVPSVLEKFLTKKEE